MQLQHADSSKWKVTLKRNELDTLMVAAKKLLEGQKGRIPRQAKNQLRDIIKSYDAECSRLYRSNRKSREKSASK